MPNKAQEEWCRDEFDRWLRGRYADTPIQWEPGSEPPDFWLTFDGRRFAVEVSRLMNQKEEALTQWLTAVRDKIAHRLRNCGALRGTYVLSFDRTSQYAAPSGTQRRDLERRLSAFVEDYVRRTAWADQDPGQDADLNPWGHWYIEKESPSNQSIRWAGGGSGGGGEEDIRGQLTALLQNRLKDKAPLAGTGPPAVLILHDFYNLAEPALFSEYVRSIPEAREFHTIYVVGPPGRGYLACGGNFRT